MAVQIDVKSDSSQAQRDLQKLQSSVEGIQKSANGAIQTFSRLAVGLGTTFAAIGGLKAITDAADTFKNLENRIALVTGRTKELYAVQKQVLQISNETRSSISNVAETYTRFGRALKNTSASQAQILQVTKAVQQSLSISGSSAEAGSAAITQLGQGLASGTLRGEELNSVLEQAPRLAEAIANSLGKSTGQLRKIAEEGQLTSDVVFKGILEQSGKINDEFKLLAPTFGQANQALSQSFVQLIHEIDNGIGLTDALASNIARNTNFIQKNLGKASFEATVFGIRARQAYANASLVASGVKEVFTSIGGAIGSILPDIRGPVTTLFGVLTNSFDKFSASLQRSISRGIFRFSDSIIGSLEDVTGYVISDTRLQRGLGNLFSARDVVEFRQALDLISGYFKDEGFGSIGVIFNNITAGFKRAIVGGEDFLIFLGILDNRIIKVFNFRTDKLSAAFDAVVEGIGRAFKAFSNFTIGDFLDDTINGIKRFGRALNGTIVGDIIDFGKKVINVFFEIYDQVVGHSYWPDMVEGVIKWADYLYAATLDRVGKFKDYVLGAFAKISETVKELFSGGINFKFSDVGDAFINGIKTALDFLRTNFPDAIRAGSVALAGFLATTLFPDTAVAGALVKGFKLFSITALILGTNFLSKLFLDSNLIGQFAQGLGETAGRFVEEIIKNLPKLAAGLASAVSGFTRGFVEQLPIIGTLFKGIFTVFEGAEGGGPTGILGAILLGKGAFSLLSALNLTESSVFKFLNLFQKSGVGGKEGLIYNAFFGGGQYSGILKLLAGVFSAFVGLSSDTFTGSLGGILAGGGLVAQIFFGNQGSTSLISAASSTISAIIGSITGNADKIVEGAGSGAAQTILGKILGLDSIDGAISLVTEEIEKLTDNLYKYASNKVEAGTSFINKLIYGQDTTNTLEENVNKTIQTVIERAANYGKKAIDTVINAGASVINGLLYGKDNAKSLEENLGKTIGDIVSKASSKTTNGVSVLSGLFKRTPDVDTAIKTTTEAVSNVGAAATASAQRTEKAFSKTWRNIAIGGALALASIASFAGQATMGAEQSSNGWDKSLLALQGIAAGLVVVELLTSSVAVSLYKWVGTLGLFGKALTGLAAITSGVFAGITAAIGAFFALPAAAIAGIITAVTALGVTIYAAFFGEGDTILDKIVDVYGTFLRYIGLVKKEVSVLDQELNKTLRPRKIANTEYNFESARNSVSLADLTGTDQTEITKLAKEFDKVATAAEKEYKAKGKLQEATEKSLAYADKKLREAFDRLASAPENFERSLKGLDDYIERLVDRGETSINKRATRIQADTGLGDFSGGGASFGAALGDFGAGEFEVPTVLPALRQFQAVVASRDLAGATGAQISDLQGYIAAVEKAAKEVDALEQKQYGVTVGTKAQIEEAKLGLERVTQLSRIKVQLTFDQIQLQRDAEALKKTYSEIISNVKDTGANVTTEQLARLSNSDFAKGKDLSEALKGALEGRNNATSQDQKRYFQGILDAEGKRFEDLSKTPLERASGLQAAGGLNADITRVSAAAYTKQLVEIANKKAEIEGKPLIAQYEIDNLVKATAAQKDLSTEIDNRNYALERGLRSFDKFSSEFSTNFGLSGISPEKILRLPDSTVKNYYAVNDQIAAYQRELSKGLPTEARRAEIADRLAKSLREGLTIGFQLSDLSQRASLFDSQIGGGISSRDTTISLQQQAKDYERLIDLNKILNDPNVSQARRDAAEVSIKQIRAEYQANLDGNKGYKDRVSLVNDIIGTQYDLNKLNMIQISDLDEAYAVSLNIRNAKQKLNEDGTRGIFLSSVERENLKAQLALDEARAKVLKEQSLTIAERFGLIKNTIGDQISENLITPELFSRFDELRKKAEELGDAIKKASTPEELLSLLGQQRANAREVTRTAKGETGLLAQDAGKAGLNTTTQGLVGLSPGDLDSVRAGIADITVLQNLYDKALIDGNTDLAATLNRNIVSFRASVQDTLDKQANLEQVGKQFSESVAGSFKTGLVDLITGKSSPKQFLLGILDNFTSLILNTVVNGFTDSLFKGVFGDTFKELGKSFATLLGDNVSAGLGDSFKSVLEKLSSLFKDLFSQFSSLFSGGESSGDGGLFSGIGSLFSGGGGLLGGLGSLLGFADGGIVPGPIGAPTLAMVHGGETIRNPGQEAQLGSGGATTINLGITGDVSRETRRNVLSMIPELAAGVNAYNREKGLMPGR